MVMVCVFVKKGELRQCGSFEGLDNDPVCYQRQQQQQPQRFVRTQPVASKQ